MKKAATDHAQQLCLAFDAPAGPPPPFQDRPASPDGMPNIRRCVVGAEVLAYRLRRGRRRSIGFQIDDHGLTVSAPRWVPLRDVEAAIREKQRWITTKLAAWRLWRERRRLPEVRFTDGGTLPYLGGPLALRLQAHAPVTRLIPGAAAGIAPELLLALPADASEVQIKDTLYAWLQGEAQRILGARLQAIAERSAHRYTSWALSSARSQWGSCTADGRIRLNWRLIHFALPVIDYVVAHELAHLQELNHGPGFWRAVGELLPGYEAARDQIRSQDLAALPL